MLELDKSVLLFTCNDFDNLIIKFDWLAKVLTFETKSI